MEALTTYPCERCRKEVCLSGHSALFYVTEDHRTLAVCADCQEMLDDAHEQIDEEELRRQRRLNISVPAVCFDCDNEFLTNLETLASSCDDCNEARNINRAHA